MNEPGKHFSFMSEKIPLENCKTCLSLNNCPHRYLPYDSSAFHNIPATNYESVCPYIQEDIAPAGNFEHLINDSKGLGKRAKEKRRLEGDEYYATIGSYSQKRRIDSTLAPLLLAVDTLSSKSQSGHSLAGQIGSTKYSPISKRNSIYEVLLNPANSPARSDPPIDERNTLVTTTSPELDPREYIQNCDIHKNQMADKYCLECSIACCSDCTFIPLHTNHRQRIELLSVVLPFMVQHYRRKYIPKYEKDLNQLTDMSERFRFHQDELKTRKDTAIRTLLIQNESIKEKLEIEFKEQLKLIEESYDNSQGLINSKEFIVKKLFQNTTDALNELSNSIHNDLSSLPSKKIEFSKKFEQISKSFQDLKPTLIYDKQPCYFEFLQPTISNLQMTEYQRVDLINPFQKMEIDVITQDVTLHFKFTEQGLFPFSSDIPKIKFHLNYMCSSCFKVNKNIPLKFVSNAETKGNLVIVKGKVLGNCEHELKWISDKDRGITLFFYLGQSKQKFEIFIPKLLKSFIK